MMTEPIDSMQNNTGYVRNVEFDIVSAFSGLDTNRKMALFDQILGNRINAYHNTMKSFWPNSTEEDARKLEIILRSRMSRLSGA